VTLDELTAYLDAQGVARQRFPERLEIVAEFPVTASGKIQKYRLREIVAAKLGQPPVR
jgi:cyclohexanecarboxylate-CoA ligase